MTRINKNIGLPVQGKVSQFGGALDRGMTPTEGVALYYPTSDDPQGLFLPGQVGRGRGLNTRAFFCAMAWDYKLHSAGYLRSVRVGVKCLRTGQSVLAWPVDYGPAAWTGRIIDVSPAVLLHIGATTDEWVEVSGFYDEQGNLID